MSPPLRCSFCLGLPAASPRRSGKISKCPVCKGALLTLPAGACRLEDMGPPPSRSGSLLVLAGAGVLLLAAVVTVRALVPQYENGPAVQAAAAAPGRPAALQLTPPGPTPPEPERPAVQTPAPSAPADDDLTRLAPLPACPPAATPPAVEDPAPPSAKPRPQRGDLGAATAAWLLKGQRLTQSDLERLLARVPEISLETETTPAKPAEARKRVEARAKQFLELTKKTPDALVEHFTATRPDLAGLPFLKGDACKLSPKEALNLAEWSVLVRTGLDRVAPSAGSRSDPRPSDGDLSRFWYSMRFTAPTERVALGTLHQVLMAEGDALRLSMVDKLAEQHSPAAASVLVRRAVFDLNDTIRAYAVAALAKHKAPDYLPELLAALRYPWAPAAQHAAEALVALELTEAVPQLVNLLDEPDPSAPFRSDDAKSGLAVREVVRVNHLRNCMLCHAPAEAPTTRLRVGSLAAPVPVPGEPLPQSRVVYYSDTRSPAFVRADITYLRQDFSVMQQVREAGEWPQHQRFDFLVRTRHLTAKEAEGQRRAAAAAAMVGPPAPTREMTPHRRSVLFALCELTKHNAGDTAEAWRRWLRAGGPTARRDRDPAEWQARSARSCLK